MSKVFGGIIKTDKACLMIALDQMFPNGYEGRDFLIDMFQEQFQDSGFPNKYFHIIEECAPVMELPKGTWNITHYQGDMYVLLTSHNQPLRFKIWHNVPVIYMYEVNAATGHAICIPASLIPHFVQTTTYSGLLIPRAVIRENIQYKG